LICIQNTILLSELLGSESNRISVRSCLLGRCVFRLSYKMSKKTTLTLSDKVKLIELKQHENLSVKELMVKFKCGKTQVYEAIKNRQTNGAVSEL